MTYFHRRTSTIIGAKAFHDPVRDGKAWDHLAMVVKRNWLPCCPNGQQSESGKKHHAWGLARGVIVLVCALRAANVCAYWSTHSTT